MAGPGCSSSMGLLMELGDYIFFEEGRLSSNQLSAHSQDHAALIWTISLRMEQFGIHTHGMRKLIYSSWTNRKFLTHSSILTLIATTTLVLASGSRMPTSEKPSKLQRQRQKMFMRLYLYSLKLSNNFRGGLCTFQGSRMGWDCHQNVRCLTLIIYRAVTSLCLQARYMTRTRSPPVREGRFLICKV